MTKAKSAKSADEAKVDEGKKAKKDASKSSVRTSASARTKPAASSKAAPAKKPAKEKAPKEAEPVEQAAVAEEKAEKPTKRRSGDTDIIPAPTPPPAPSFGSSGLGIKVASKKPALSVAPGVMILGRPAQAKPTEPPRPSDRRLSKKEKEDIKNTLIERRERLLAGMRRELAMQKERAESKVADEVDKATDAYDEDLSFEIAAANDQELKEIQVALEKIEKGTYGECEICGCGISPSRLKILPSATTCVSCRGQEEMARRRDDGQPMFSILSEDAEAEGEVL